MNLKYVHIFFITLASLLLFGIAAMEYMAYREGGLRDHWNWALAWGSAGVVLVAYAIYFIRKARRLIL